MNPRELVTLIVGTFRGSPVRESGSEAVYKVHQLRAALELLCEAVATTVDLTAPNLTKLQAFGTPTDKRRADLGLFAAWRELVMVAGELPPPAPLGTLADAVAKGRSLHRYVLDLLTCEHGDAPIEGIGSAIPVVAAVPGLTLCLLCGARRHAAESEDWRRPLLLEQLGRSIGVLS